jgi:hypothetical protein
VQNDEPTLPDLRRAMPGAPPTWPVPDAGGQQPRMPQRLTIGCLGGMALGISAVVLVGVGALLSHLGFFAFDRSVPPSTPGVSGPSAGPSPTTVAAWLQITPTSIQLGCGDGQQSLTVTLVNRGPQSVQWQASLSVPPDQAGIAVSPQAGELASGASAAIQLQLHHQDQGAGNQQGVIRFAPMSTEAGPAPSLSYSLGGGCN